VVVHAVQFPGRGGHNSTLIITINLGQSEVRQCHRHISWGIYHQAPQLTQSDHLSIIPELLVLGRLSRHRLQRRNNHSCPV